MIFHIIISSSNTHRFFSSSYQNLNIKYYLYITALGINYIIQLSNMSNINSSFLIIFFICSSSNLIIYFEGGIIWIFYYETLQVEIVENFILYLLRNQIISILFLTQLILLSYWCTLCIFHIFFSINRAWDFQRGFKIKGSFVIITWNV